MGNLSQHLSVETEQFFHLQTALQQIQLRVDPQSAAIFELDAQDDLELNLPTDQGIEILVRNAQGKIQLPLLQLVSPNGIIGIGTAVQTLEQLVQQDSVAQRLEYQLQKFNIAQTDLEVVLRVQHTEQVRFHAPEALSVIVLNTGKNMQVDQHDAIDEVQVIIHKAKPQTGYLPAPLAQPIQEIRVNKASAKTYRVKAGQWIQIIDVSGKQCSDFLAFDANALSQGQEIGLDAVATRTLLGHSTPTPGIHSRFYGTDMQALVEVVQDTVGRHDMFLTACSPKFYEDSGYFGHISCTENFNRILNPLGLAPKAAWPAINFFYNTQVEPCGSISMDEPWSRAGDYILLRAHKDLLCASSACPDDIDPSNGWVPSDIHVRIYAESERFPRSQLYRTHPEEMPRMTKQSGFHSRIAALTSQLVEYHGYWVANEYHGWGAKAEYLACRERVAMIDLTALRKFEITGPDAESFLQYMLTRNVRKLAIGEIVYSAICLETGGMLDDGTIFRLGENNFRWVCGDEYTGTWLKQKAQQLGYRVSIRHSSDQIHNVAVQGPRSRELLKQLIWTPEHQPNLDQLAWFHFTLGRLGNAQGIPVMVSRTGYTGELGFEVWCHPTHAEQVWDAIWSAGQAFEIAPMGFAALDMLRIEAGLIFAQHEFDAQTNPFEAGIGFTVPLKSKEEDFLGKQAMQNQTAQSRHKLVGLILEQNEAAEHGDLIYVDRYPVGVVTSATNSPLLKKQIALCRVAPQYASAETTLEVGKLDGQKKRLKAKVVNLPFYDPERTRVRA
ncbi:aminomethyltransferase [Serratia sp. S1B]|nr:aminomethyltransferase [Serratia sp. S1B]